jgi:hypothetical protein
MARYAITHKITTPRKLEGFDLEGYAFDARSAATRPLRFPALKEFRMSNTARPPAPTAHPAAITPELRQMDHRAGPGRLRAEVVLQVHVRRGLE